MRSTSVPTKRPPLVSQPPDALMPGAADGADQPPVVFGVFVADGEADLLGVLLGVLLGLPLFSAVVGAEDGLADAGAEPRADVDGVAVPIPATGAEGLSSGQKAKAAAPATSSPAATPAARSE
ncbi:hypothetical protein AB0J52_42150 [Spirillospora sp. NPDC049652]